MFVIKIRLTDETYSGLKKLAWLNGANVDEYCEEILEQFVEENVTVDEEYPEAVNDVLESF